MKLNSEEIGVLFMISKELERLSLLYDQSSYHVHFPESSHSIGLFVDKMDNIRSLLTGKEEASKEKVMDLYIYPVTTENLTIALTAITNKVKLVEKEQNEGY